MADVQLFHNISDLITLAPLAKEKRTYHIKDADLGRHHKNAWFTIEDGKISQVGSGDLPTGHFQKTDLKGALVMPGLVDAHTHPVFAGDRSHEFAKRLKGATYQEIGEAGGGIKYTVQKTREASLEELTKKAEDTFQKFLSHGVTTVEAKSGYGLSPQEEIKLLKAIQSAKTNQTVKSTCLALHAIPKGYQKSKSDFIREMTEDLLPQVVEEKLADFVDAFIEQGYFSISEAEPYMQKAKELGLGIRVHVDEFTDGGGAKAAAHWGAASADHLEYASKDGIKAMAENKVTAFLLPGTSLYCAIKFAKAKEFRRAGCGVALATDYNPGSCQLENLNFIASLGVLHAGLTPAETIAAVTYVPSFSLGLQDSKGALAEGFDADFVAYEAFDHFEGWLASMGQRQPSGVWINGQSQL